MARPKVVIHSEGVLDVFRQWARNDGVPRMERSLAAAKADTHDDTGAYEAGLHIEVVMTDRPSVRLVSGDWKGHILEARYGILTRALDAAGGE